MEFIMGTLGFIFSYLAIAFCISFFDIRDRDRDRDSNDASKVGIMGIFFGVIAIVIAIIFFINAGEDEIEESLPISQKPQIPISQEPQISLDPKLYNIPALQDILVKKENFYTQQKEAVHSAEQIISQLEGQLAQAKKELDFTKETLSKIDEDVKELTKKLKIGHFAHFKAKVEQEKIVEEAYGEQACEKYTVSECKELAKEKARKNAAEQGTTILVTSETVATFFKDIKDLKINEQTIRSQMEALVSNPEVLEEGFIGKGSVYFYRIRATVKGQVPPALQAEILR